jgi:hypothetical protein
MPIAKPPSLIDPAPGGPSAEGATTGGKSAASRPTGKYFSIDYFNGDNTLTVQLGSSDQWVNNGEKTRITMQIDNGSP